MDQTPGFKTVNLLILPGTVIKILTFQKEIHFLLETGVTTPLQQSEYSITIFVIPKK